MSAGRRLLYVISLNHFTNDSSTALISSLFPAALGLFGLDYFQVGTLVAVGLVINVLVQPVVGRYTDRLPGRGLLAAGTAVIMASMVLFASSGDFLGLLLAVVVLRTGSSFYHPVGMATVSRSYGRAESDSAMGFQVAFGYAGILTAFLFGGFVYEGFGWGGPFYLWVAMAVATILVTTAGMGGARPAGTLVVPEGELWSGPAKAGHTPDRGVRADRATAFLGVTSVAVVSASTVVINFGNLLLTGRGLGLVPSDFGVALFIAGAILGSFGFGRARREFSNASLVAIAAATVAAVDLLLALVDFPVLDVSVLLVAGLANALANSAVYSLVADLVRAERRGYFFGVLFAFQTLGVAAVLFVGGFLAQNLGIGTPFILSAALLLPTGAWALSLRRAGGIAGWA